MPLPMLPSTISPTLSTMPPVVVVPLRDGNGSSIPARVAARDTPAVGEAYGPADRAAGSSTMSTGSTPTTLTRSRQGGGPTWPRGNTASVFHDARGVPTGTPTPLATE